MDTKLTLWPPWPAQDIENSPPYLRICSPKNERGDANRVSAWVKQPLDAVSPAGVSWIVIVRNRAELPVYDCRVGIEHPSASSPHDIGSFPGEFETEEVITLSAVDPANPPRGAYITFTDAAGRRWQWAANGELTRFSM